MFSNYVFKLGRSRRRHPLGGAGIWPSAKRLARPVDRDQPLSVPCRRCSRHGVDAASRYRRRSSAAGSRRRVLSRRRRGAGRGGAGLASADSIYTPSAAAVTGRRHRPDVLRAPGTWASAGHSVDTIADFDHAGPEIDVIVVTNPNNPDGRVSPPTPPHGNCRSAVAARRPDGCRRSLRRPRSGQQRRPIRRCACRKARGNSVAVSGARARRSPKPSAWPPPAD